MHVTPPQDVRPIEPLASRPTRRRRLLRPMLVGSLLLHLLLLAAFLLFPSEPPTPTTPPDSDEVAMVFDTPTGDQQASTPSPQHNQQATVAAGSAAAPEAPPTPTNTSAPLPPPPAPTPPTPPAPTPPTPAPPVPTPPIPTPPVTAQTEPPAPETPPPPNPPPPVPQPPPTVSLNPEDEADMPPPPAFQMPQPPPPLPPLPRPPPPRLAARPTPSNPFASLAPQDWSLNSVPTQQAPGRPSRGFDMSVANQGGPNSEALGYVSGAKPSGDWMSALRRWVDARKYYPEQAIAQLDQGSVTLLVDIDRSGHVLSVQLASTSRSPFLDGAFIDLFRRATVPPFTPDMTEQTTTLRATMHFVLRTGR